MENIGIMASEKGVWENGGKGNGIKKQKLVVNKIVKGMLRASIGNGVAKELICMTHGPEQW